MCPNKFTAGRNATFAWNSESLEGDTKGYLSLATSFHVPGEKWYRSDKFGPYTTGKNEKGIRSRV